MVQLIRVHRMYPLRQALDSRLIQTALFRSSHDNLRQRDRGFCHPLGSRYISGRCLDVLAGREVLEAFDRGIVYRREQFLLRTADSKYFDGPDHSHYAIEGCLGSTNLQDAETFAFGSLHGWRTVSGASSHCVAVTNRTSEH